MDAERLAFHGFIALRFITLVHPPCPQGLNIDRLGGLVIGGWRAVHGASVSCLIIDVTVHYLSSLLRPGKKRERLLSDESQITCPACRSTLIVSAGARSPRHDELAIRGEAGLALAAVRLAAIPGSRDLFGEPGSFPEVRGVGQEFFVGLP